jgi:hypothetical protein
MHAPRDQDDVLKRADAALSAARQLRRELSDQVAAGLAESRRAQRVKILQSGLTPFLAIALLTGSEE